MSYRWFLQKRILHVTISRYLLCFPLNPGRYHVFPGCGCKGLLTGLASFPRTLLLYIKVPGPGVELVPQQWLEPLHQHQILNLLCHKGTPKVILLKYESNHISPLLKTLHWLLNCSPWPIMAHEVWALPPSSTSKDYSAVQGFPSVTQRYEAFASHAWACLIPVQMLPPQKDLSWATL